MRDKITEAIMGHSHAPGDDHEPYSGLVEGTVYDITATGMRFVFNDWDGGVHIYGPAPWPKAINTQFATDNGNLVIGATAEPHTHNATATEQLPVAGDRCLVAFTNGGPWVIGWWPA